jgi:hypothetical protein
MPIREDLDEVIADFTSPMATRTISITGGYSKPTRLALTATVEQ